MKRKFSMLWIFGVIFPSLSFSSHCCRLRGTRKVLWIWNVVEWGNLGNWMGLAWTRQHCRERGNFFGDEKISSFARSDEQDLCWIRQQQPTREPAQLCVLQSANWKPRNGAKFRVGWGVKALSSFHFHIPASSITYSIHTYTRHGGTNFRKNYIMLCWKTILWDEKFSLSLLSLIITKWWIK